MSSTEKAVAVLRRIAAGERLVLVFRWWLPGTVYSVEWEADGGLVPYPVVKLLGERGWAEPQPIDEDRSLIVLTEAGRQFLQSPFLDHAAGI